jgi:hypothetical protein
VKQIEKLDSHKEYGYNEQDTGHKLDEVIEAVNTLTERLEKLETDENRITGTLSTDKTFKIFWKDKHISMELPTQVEPDKHSEDYKRGFREAIQILQLEEPE